MKFNLIAAFLITLLTAIGAAAQTDAKLNAEKASLTPELKAKLVLFLKATGRDAQILALPENRVRHQLDAAQLLWQHDEKSAREMFASAINDFRPILNSLDAFQQQLETGENEDDNSFLGFMGGGSESSRFYAAGNVRRNLLLAIGKRDGALAFDFMNETARPNFPSWNDAAFEAQLANVVAAHDPARAVQLAQQKLAKNEFQGLNEVAQNVYLKDKTKGAKLAQDVLKKLRAANLKDNNGALTTAAALFNGAVELLEPGAQTTADKTALLSEADTRELAEVVVKAIAAQQVKYNYNYFSGGGSEELFKRLQKYAPASAARLTRAKPPQVEAVFEADEPDAPVISATPNNSASGSGSGPIGVVSTTAVSTQSSVVVAESDEIPANTAAARRAVQQQAIAKLIETANSPNAKISADEVRQTLQPVGSRLQRLVALAQIAKAVAARGDKETARTLLADLSELQVAQPRKAADMLQNLMLADAFARVEPERAFAIIESTIYEFNTVISSFARIGDFIGAREIADNGEFNMSSLPGDFMQIANGSAALGADVQLIFKALAEHDFARTAALADKFDKPEIRLEARMLIARIMLPAEPQDTMK